MIPKYSLNEIERRWLIDQPLHDSPLHVFEIEFPSAGDAASYQARNTSPPKSRTFRSTATMPWQDEAVHD